MPSDTETLGFVVLESLASGVPVVGVAAGGVVDIIRHGETGFLTSNDDNMTEFSNCVQRLIKDSSLRQRMGSAGADWAKGWSWEAATDKLRNVQYKKAIALHGCRDVNGRHVRTLEERILQNE
jgi:sulfoquinovosyltransferase